MSLFGFYFRVVAFLVPMFLYFHSSVHTMSLAECASWAGMCANTFNIKIRIINYNVRFMIKISAMITYLIFSLMNHISKVYEDRDPNNYLVTKYLVRQYKVHILIKSKQVIILLVTLPKIRPSFFQVVEINYFK